MFKNLIAYRLAADFQVDADALEEKLEAGRFAPCGATQALSAGWVPPRGEPGAALLENIGGHLLLRLRIEKRVLSGSVVRDRVEELADAIERETARRPGRKQCRDLKDQATLDLLPKAFTTHSHLTVWIAPGQGLLMVDASSIGRADDVITLLVRAEPKLRLHLLQTAESPAACMAAWLMDGVPPKDFVIDRDCELKAADEMKAAVRYARHNLDTDEVKKHLTAGKMPTRLAMTWKERVSFVLTDTMQIRGIKFLDIVFDGRTKPAKDEAFDVDAALATGELSQMLPDLIEGLGGELDFIGQSRAIAAAHAPQTSGTAVNTTAGGGTRLVESTQFAGGRLLASRDEGAVDVDRPGVTPGVGLGDPKDGGFATVNEGLLGHGGLHFDQKRSTEVCRHDLSGGAA